MLDGTAALFVTTDSLLHIKGKWFIEGLLLLSSTQLFSLPLTCFIGSCIKDGMDQSKWSMPRCRNNLLTKSLAKHERVRTKIQGVWLHQVALFLYCLDTRLSADSSMVVECVSRALQRMSEICQARGVNTPRKLILWVSCSETWPIVSLSNLDHTQG